MSSYTIRKLLNNEFHLLIPLMKDCFGVNVSIEYFEWKFLKNPAGFVEGFIAVSEENEVAAYYGAIPEAYLLDGEKKIIYQSCDTMTHSKHRRKGLFQKLALQCYKYLEDNNKLFVVGFGGEQSTPGFLKFGWAQIFNVRYYFYPKLFSALRLISSTANIFEIENYAEIENLVLISNTNSLFHSHKSLDVFAWRLSNPTHQYKVLAYKDDGNAAHYSSYLCYYISGDKIMLFDFYFQNLAEGNALTGYLKNLLPKSKLKGIIAFLQENSYYSLTIKKFGFISNPFNKGPLSTKTPFIFFTGKNQMEEYKIAGKWLIGSFEHDAM